LSNRTATHSPPSALIDGIVALALTGIPLSVSSAIGVIALFGEAVLNGVVMVSYDDQLRAQGMNPTEAVLRGSLTRLPSHGPRAFFCMHGR
jgi:cobalt-zinc-cadmium resistance protein CzcA